MNGDLLDGTALESALKRIPDWEYKKTERSTIHRKFEFDNFDTAFNKFMTAVAVEAERVDHHPEWLSLFSSFLFSLFTSLLGSTFTTA